MNSYDYLYLALYLSGKQKWDREISDFRVSRFALSQVGQPLQPRHPGKREDGDGEQRCPQDAAKLPSSRPPPSRLHAQKSRWLKKKRNSLSEGLGPPNAYGTLSITSRTLKGFCSGTTAVGRLPVSKRDQKDSAVQRITIPLARIKQTRACPCGGPRQCAPGTRR